MKAARSFTKRPHICAARDCSNQFPQTKAWRKFCSVRCKNRELQNRKRDREKSNV